MWSMKVAAMSLPPVARMDSADWATTDALMNTMATTETAGATAAWVALDAARRPPTPPYIPLHPLTSPQRWTALYDAPYIPL